MPKSFVFTEATIKAMKPPGDGREREYHKDKTFPGLQVCVTSTGRRTYYLVKRVEGKPTRLLLGTVGQLSVDAARKAAAKHAAKIADGKNPQAERRTRREEPTLGVLWEHWLIYSTAHNKPITVRYDKLRYAKHLKRWEGRRLSTIKRADVQARHAEIGRECGPYAANQAMRLLRAMYNKADEIGYGGANPCARIKMFKETSRDRFLQPGELARFFAALESENETFRDFFWTCLLTGARKSNVLSMKWADVDLAAGHWWIREQKGGVPVLVPLVPELLTILHRRHAAANGSPWVFAGHRVGDHLREPREAWKRICAAAEIADLHVHDLRRSLGSWMAGSNASLPIIGKMLGHSTPQATMIYSRLAVDPVRAAAEKAATAMLAAGGQAKLLTVQEGHSNG